MRNLVEVIDQMLVHIPAECRSFILELENQKESICYTAPEVMSSRWRTVTNILREYMREPPFSEHWRQAVYDIWMDK